MDEDALVNALADAMRKGTRAGLTQMAGELVSMQRRIAQLEAQPRLKFLGIHEPGASYTPGSLVVRSGGLWHCNQPTTEMPGHSSHWQLATKSGQVAKRVVSVR